MRLTPILTLFLVTLALMIWPRHSEAQYDGGYDGGYVSDGGYDGGYGGDGGYDGSYGGQDGGYNDGGYDGCYGPCGGAITLSGYTYLDSNKDGSFNNGDTGIPLSTIQIVIPAYTSAAWTEVTSTDENGNPTGFIDHPAQYHPEEIRYTAQTDANGHYSIPNIASRTYEVRHTMPVAGGFSRINPSTNSVTLNINMSRIQSFGVYYFEQNLPQSPCSGVNPSTSLTWNAQPGAANYKVFFLESTAASYVDNNLVTNQTNYTFSSSSPLIPGKQYSFLIVALNSSGSIIAYSDNSQWSHEKYGSYTPFPVCSGSSITLTLTGPSSSQQSGGLPLQVDQNQPVNLTWSVAGVTNNSCTASVASGDGSAVPGAITAAWNGSKGPPPNPGGPQSIPTATPGNYVFSLTCLVGAAQTASSIQLNVLTFPRPYIQTTGGDVHTNETITITP